MRFKLIIFSLLAIGVSCPSLAASIYMIDRDYQQEIMQAQVNKMNGLLDRNQSGGFDQPCGWKCRINLSGWINTDAYITNTPPVFVAEDPFSNIFTLTETPFHFTNSRTSDLILNNANLFIDTRVNNWMKANMSLVYTSLISFPGAQGVYQAPHSLLFYRPINISRLDTAYATLQPF